MPCGSLGLLSLFLDARHASRLVAARHGSEGVSESLFHHPRFSDLVHNILSSAKVPTFDLLYHNRTNNHHLFPFVLFFLLFKLNWCFFYCSSVQSAISFFCPHLSGVLACLLGRSARGGRFFKGPLHSKWFWFRVWDLLSNRWFSVGSVGKFCY